MRNTQTRPKYIFSVNKTHGSGNIYIQSTTDDRFLWRPLGDKMTKPSSLYKNSQAKSIRQTQLGHFGKQCDTEWAEIKQLRKKVSRRGCLRQSFVINVLNLCHTVVPQLSQSCWENKSGQKWADLKCLRQWLQLSGIPGRNVRTFCLLVSSFFSLLFVYWTQRKVTEHMRKSGSKYNSVGEKD